MRNETGRSNLVKSFTHFYTGRMKTELNCWAEVDSLILIMFKYGLYFSRFSKIPINALRSINPIRKAVRVEKSNNER